MKVRINELSPTEWDAFVGGVAQGDFMQSWAWGELQRGAGWSPDYVAVDNGSEIRAAALVLWRNVPGMGQTVGYAPRGPVLLDTDPEAARALIVGLKSMAAKRGGFLRADPYVLEQSPTERSLSDGGFDRIPRTWSYWNAPKYVFWLDLHGDEEAMLKGVQSNYRTQIRSGYKKGVEFSRGSVDDIGTFHRLMVKTGQTKAIAVHDEAYYRQLFVTLNKSCPTELFLAHFEGQCIAVGMSVRSGNTAWLMYAASDPEHYKLRVNRTIQWEMIKWALASGCTRYDFRGTATGDPPDPNDPGYGVYEFKKSFGPQFTRLAGYFDLVGGPLKYRMFRFAEEKLLPQAYRAKVWLDERRARR